MIDKIKIYEYCEARWDFYEKQDGGYYPSKHDKAVFEDATKEFNLTIEEIDKAFSEISKVKADNMVKGLNKNQMADLFKTIVENNAETPWGQMKLKNNK